jgi:phenylalanine ammonia-lyase
VLTSNTGVNTGFGGSADARNNDVEGLQRALVGMLHYGTLSPGPRDPVRHDHHQSLHQYDLANEQNPETLHLPETWTRAAILVRLNSLMKGYSAVRPETVTRIHDLLERDIIPIIPLRGSISASGDLSPLSYIAGAIQGKSSIRIHSKAAPIYADQALAHAGLAPVSLEAKEGLAIVNGTAVSGAAAAVVLHDTHFLAVLSQIITAMSVEALNGTAESFDPFLSSCRPHPGQVSHQSKRAKSIFLKESID